MRAIGGVILQEWGEQPPSKAVQVFSKPRILQEAVQAKGGDIQQVLSIVITTGLPRKRARVSERHFQVVQRVVMSTLDDPERVSASVCEQGIAHLRGTLWRLSF